jgi:hypothetical protein
MRNLTFLFILIISAAVSAFNTQDSKVYLQISHEVKNFPEWKKAFEADNINREKSGIKTVAIYTVFENRNMVTIIAEVSNLQIAKAFISNPDLKVQMAKAGVISTPEIKIYKKQS